MQCVGPMPVSLFTFIARFVGGLSAWQLLLALLIVPSVPIAIWFSVLYYYFSNALEIGTAWRLAMVVVGAIYVTIYFLVFQRRQHLVQSSV